MRMLSAVYRAAFTGTAILITFSAAALAQPISFIARRDIPPGISNNSGTNMSIATGDFNGDGRRDIAVMSEGAIAILLANADGSFQAPKTKSAGAKLFSIVAADFNGDGKLDLATAESEPGRNSVLVFLGKGDGTLQDPVSYSVGATPRDVATGDLNGDGMPDLVTADYDSNTISVLIGKGDGTFAAAIQYPLRTVHPTAVALADFNGDGRLDVASAPTAYDDSGVTTVLLNNGNGTFRAASTIYIKGFKLIAADLNGDGKADLATATSMALGNGDGTFQAPSQIAGELSIAAGDLNGDGIIDLVTAGLGGIPSAPAASIHSLIGIGAGNFQEITSFDLPGFWDYHGLALADMNGDGRLDLIFGGTSSVSLVLGTGSGTFQLARKSDMRASTVGGNGESVLADFNGDGKLDIAYIATTTYPSSVFLALGDGQGGFSEGPALGEGTYALASADFDGDGRPDLAVHRGSTIAILLARANGTFLAGPVYTVGTDTRRILTADFNRDGKPDLAVADSSGTVYVLLGSGNGAFQTPATTVAAFPPGIAVADFNNDGIPDLVSVTATGIAVNLGKGDGTFHAPILTSSESRGYLAAGDFNGDGRQDLIVSSSPGPILLPGNGDGTFGVARPLPAMGGYGMPIAADFNGDGKLDLAVDGVVIYPGRGNGDFGQPLFFEGGGYFMATGDLNGDGRLDLVTSSSWSTPKEIIFGHYVRTVLLNNSGTGPLPPATIIVSVPTRRTFTTDGQTYITPQIFHWSPGSAHAISWPSPQAPTYSGEATYAFSAWIDGEAVNLRTITASISGGLYGAKFEAVPGTCKLSLSGPSTFTDKGGTGALTISNPDNCLFGASSNASWLSVYNDNEPSFWVRANPGPQRSAQITLSGGGTAAFTVTQEAYQQRPLGFVPLGPERVVDTRVNGGISGDLGPHAMEANTERLFPIGLQYFQRWNVMAYALNVTAVPAGPLGYLTLWPGWTSRPWASTLNSLDGRIVANAAIVPAGPENGVKVYASATTDVIIDWNGIFVPMDQPGHPVGASGALAFYILPPCRVVDTRVAGMPPGLGTPSLVGSRSFGLRYGTCGIPATAKAYSLNATVIPSGPLGYLKLWPSTAYSPPEVSTLNSDDGSIVANAAIVLAGNEGAIGVTASSPSDVVLDINGYFAPPGMPNALNFYLVTPCRVADTRDGDGHAIPGGTSRDFNLPASNCGVPPTAKAYSVNITVVPSGPLGYLTAWPAGTAQPVVSTLNSPKGRILANAAIVPAGANGAMSVYVSADSHVVIDINGYFAP